MGNNLLDNVMSTFFSGNLKEKIMSLLLEKNSISGTTHTEKWACFLNIIANWKIKYQVKSSTMSLYGYITWNLDISEHQFLCSEPSQLKQLLLKALLVSYFCDTTNMQFKEQADIAECLEIELFELLDLTSCSEITKDDFIADMQCFYEGSNTRLKHHKVKYAQHTQLNQKLEAAALKFRKYIAWFEQYFENGQIVRINRLGEYESSMNAPTEQSLYFYLSGQTLYLLILSDFA